MNPNIEVINENLLAVNFSYVCMGYIRDFSFENTTPSDMVTLTNDGKLIFNKADDAAMKYILPIMKAVMVFPERLLNTEKGFCVYIRAAYPQMEKLDDESIVQLLKKVDSYATKHIAFETACKWEAERRKQKKEFTRKHWFSIWIRKILKKGR